MITAPPTLVEREPTKTYKHRRDILDDIASGVDSVLSGLGSGAVHDEDLRYLIRMSDFAACARRLRTAFAERALRGGWAVAQSALRRLDADALRQIGATMLRDGQSTAGSRPRLVRQAAIDLMLAAVLIERSPRLVAELRSGIRP